MIKVLCRLGIALFVSMIALLSVRALSFARDVLPQRIISLSPPITEELYLLGAEDMVVGVTVYCQNPPAALNKEKIGTVTDVNVEKIAGLKPDLVLASALTDPRDLGKLENLGIRVEVFPQAETFDRLCEEFLRLAKLIGKEERAREIVSESTAAINSIKEKTAGLNRTTVFVQIGASPLFTATAESYINDFIGFAGGTNIAEGSPTGFYSREKVIAANPGVILIVLMGISGKEEKEIWEKFSTVNAVKNNRVHILDAYIVCSPTPVTFVKGIRDIVSILHPGLKVE